MIGRNPRRVLLVSMLALLCVSHSVAHATVYSWKGEGGVLMLSNDPKDVPPDQQASVRKFTSTPAPAPAPVADDEDPTVQPPRAGGARVDAYQRGFDAGLEAAERQVALANELARTVLAAIPQTPPAPVVIEQSAPPAAPYGGWYASPYYASPYYGFGYPPYPFLYGFAVSSFPRRHFFPGFRGRRFAPFFPHGGFSHFPHGGFSRFPHGGFSRTGFGRMR
jgi:hypothetical protein